MTASISPTPSAFLQGDLATHAPLVSSSRQGVGSVCPVPGIWSGPMTALKRQNREEGCCVGFGHGPHLSGSLRFLPPGGQLPHRSVTTLRLSCCEKNQATARVSGRPDDTRKEREVEEEEVNRRMDAEAILEENSPAPAAVAWSKAKTTSWQSPS